MYSDDRFFKSIKRAFVGREKNADRVPKPRRFRKNIYGLDVELKYDHRLMVQYRCRCTYANVTTDWTQWENNLPLTGELEYHGADEFSFLLMIEGYNEVAR